MGRYEAWIGLGTAAPLDKTFGSPGNASIVPEQGESIHRLNIAFRYNFYLLTEASECGSAAQPYQGERRVESPGGTIQLSPARQRWADARVEGVPEGRH
jgi:hypothetical protein